MDDLLVRGGHVIDGTGAAGRDADVSIAAGRIVAIEPRSSRPTYRAIDARGQVDGGDHTGELPGRRLRRRN